MIEKKIRANLLKFDIVDLMNIMFPKDCNIDIPTIIPITYPDRDCIVGHVSAKRDDTGIVIEGLIEMNDEMNCLFSDKDVYVGGQYYVHEFYKNSEGIRMIKSANLTSMGLFEDDIYGDKTTLLKEVKEDD